MTSYIYQYLMCCLVWSIVCMKVHRVAYTKRKAMTLYGAPLTWENQRVCCICI